MVECECCGTLVKIGFEACALFRVEFVDEGDYSEDACNICLKDWMTEIPEQIKSVVKINGQRKTI